MGQEKQHVKKKKSLLINAKNFYDGREMIIDAFKNKIFPLVPTDFEDDVDEDKLLKKRHEKDSRRTRQKENQKIDCQHLKKLWNKLISQIEFMVLT